MFSSAIEIDIDVSDNLIPRNICDGTSAKEIIPLIVCAFFSAGDETIDAMQIYTQKTSKEAANEAFLVRIPLDENYAKHHAK